MNSANKQKRIKIKTKIKLIFCITTKSSLLNKTIFFWGWGKKLHNRLHSMKNVPAKTKIIL